MLVFSVVNNLPLQVWALVGGNDKIASHFYELVPDMAIDFPFELDSFQKEVGGLILLIIIFCSIIADNTCACCRHN